MKFKIPPKPNLINLFISCVTLRELAHVSIIKLLMTSHRAIISSILMIIIIFVVDYAYFSSINNSILSFVALVMLGAASYIASVFVFWKLSGKPDSIEKSIFSKLKLYNEPC